MSILNLDLHQLLVFYKVATEESISIAAEKLCLTQPTVSYHLKSLENHCGVKLFNIRKQRVYLTKAGQDIYTYMQEIWSQLTNIDKYLSSLKTKSIRIGVTPLLHNQVTAALSKLCKLHTDLNIDIEIANSIQIIQEVSDKETDIGIVLRASYENNKVIPTRLSDHERLVFVASPNSTLAQKDNVELADLANHPIICGQPGSLLHNLVTEKFRIAGILTSPHIMVSTLSTDVLKIFVKEGNALGLWHIKNVEAEVLAGELIILPLSENILVPIDFIVHSDADPSDPINQEILEYVKQELTNASEPYH
jgi:DNA-binding transcriptional LysR family regulator